MMIRTQQSGRTERDELHLTKRRLRITTAAALTLPMIALAGPSVAHGLIGTSDIKNGAVTAKKIKNNAVKTTKIKDGAVTGTKLAPGAVGSGQLAAGAVGSGQLAAGAVGAGKIAAGAVGSANLAAGSVGASKLADNIKVYRSGSVPGVNAPNTTFDGSNVTLQTVAAPQLTAQVLNSSLVHVEMSFGLGLQTLPYTSFAGGKVNTMWAQPEVGQIKIYRFAHDNTASVGFGALTYRYTIVPSTSGPAAVVSGAVQGGNHTSSVG